MVLRHEPTSVLKHTYTRAQSHKREKEITHHPIRPNIRRQPLLLGVLRALTPPPQAHNLNPIPIRIQRKRNMLHASILQSLLEPIPRLLDPLTSGLDIINGDTHVSEPAMGLRVAVIHFVRRVVLGPVVVRQLDEALAVERAVPVGMCGWAVVPEEVEVEFRFGELKVLY